MLLLSLAPLPQQKKTPFKLAILYNKSIAGAHPSFLLEEATLSHLLRTRLIIYKKRTLLYLWEMN